MNPHFPFSPTSRPCSARRLEKCRHSIDQTNQCVWCNSPNRRVMPEIPLRADSIAPPIEEEADATRPTVGEASRYRGCEEPFEPATETRRSRRGTDGVTCACRSVPCQYRACSVNTVPVLSILWLVLSIPCLFCQYRACSVNTVARSVNTVACSVNTVPVLSILWCLAAI